MAGRRRSLPVETTKQTGIAAEKVAEEQGVPLDSVRWAEYTYHNGQNWTIRTCWEIRCGDRWEEVREDRQTLTSFVDGKYFNSPSG